MDFVKLNESGEDLYALALKYRDNKVEGFSSDESTSEAEKLFLQLANEGYSKAMHNYASIQYRKNNFEEAFKYFSKSELSASKKNCTELLEKHLVKQDVYLIVGSERDLDPTLLRYVDDIHGRNVDLTHIRSFGGKSITMDVVPSQVPNAKHIVADASTYDFVKNKFNVKHVVLERLPTHLNNMSGMSADANRMLNITGNIVKQIAKAMQTGAILEIEWEPFTSCNFSSEEENEYLRSQNPFNGFMNNETVFNAAKFNFDVNSNRNISPEIRTMASLQLKEHVYYTSHGMTGTARDSIERVAAEIHLMEQMMRYPGAWMLGSTIVDIENDTTPEITRGLNASLIHSCLNKYKHREHVVIQHPEKQGVTLRGMIITPQSFACMSLLNYMSNNISVQLNTPHVVQYLESIGFKNVSVTRRTNKHNGRQNVWMVDAVKT